MRTRNRLLIAIGVGVLVVVVLAGALWFLRGAPISGTAVAPSETAYQIYFTNPVFPDRAESHRGGIDEKLVQFVDISTRTLDLAVYDFDLENVALAIARAKARGVQVRMVTDTDTIENHRDEHIQRALGIVRDAGVEIVSDGRSAIMHHKFAVRDGEEVWTGSWNWTTGDTYRLNNNVARLRSAELAAVFTREFDKMHVQRLFGASKRTGPPMDPIQLAGLRIQALFAPQDGVARSIAERIGLSASRVSFMAFSFTHDDIGQSVLARHRAGVPVVGVFETTGSRTRFSEFGAMKESGLDVYQDGNPYVMHHKVFVLDGRTTVFGSFNFSDGADRENDENCLIVDGEELAAEFGRELDRVVAAARSPSPRRGSPEPERPR